MVVLDIPNTQGDPLLTLKYRRFTVQRQIGLVLCIFSILCLVAGLFTSHPVSTYLLSSAALLGAASSLCSWMSTRPKA